MKRIISQQSTCARMAHYLCQMAQHLCRSGTALVPGEDRYSWITFGWRVSLFWYWKCEMKRIINQQSTCATMAHYLCQTAHHLCQIGTGLVPGEDLYSRVENSRWRGSLFLYWKCKVKRIINLQITSARMVQRLRWSGTALVREEDLSSSIENRHWSDSIFHWKWATKGSITFRLKIRREGNHIHVLKIKPEEDHYSGIEVQNWRGS